MQYRPRIACIPVSAALHGLAESRPASRRDRPAEAAAPVRPFRRVRRLLVEIDGRRRRSVPVVASKFSRSSSSGSAPRGRRAPGRSPRGRTCSCTPGAISSTTPSSSTAVTVANSPAVVMIYEPTSAPPASGCRGLALARAEEQEPDHGHQEHGKMSPSCRRCCSSSRPAPLLKSRGESRQVSAAPDQLAHPRLRQLVAGSQVQPAR